MSKNRKFSRNRKETEFSREPAPVTEKEESAPKKGWLDFFFTDDKDEEKVVNDTSPEEPGDEGEEKEKPEFLNTVRDSVINLDSYVGFREIRTTTAFGFIGLVLLLIILLKSLDFSLTVIKVVDNLADFYQAKLPAIVVKNGEAEVQGNVKMPLEVLYKNQWGDIPIIVDTTGTVKNLEKREQGILITKTDIFMKLKDGKMQTIPFEKADSGDFTLDAKYIKDFKKGFFSSFFPLLIVFWYLGRGVVLLIQILVVAMVGMGISKAWQIDIKFNEMLNICIYASVPALILLMILDISGAFRILAQMVLPGVVILSKLGLYYFTFFMYLYLGLERIKKSMKESTP